MRIYKDRKEAGERLASLLLPYKKKKETLVLGLPRGGVVVAAQVAVLLQLPLEIILPRKLGAPFNPELAIGAIAGDELLLHEDRIRELGISKSYLQKEILKQKEEAKRRGNLFRGGKKEREFKNKTLLLIDDGIATGATLEASILFLKKQKVKKIVVAVPVAPLESFLRIQKMVDEMICPIVAKSFSGVSEFYETFDQTQDEEVIQILARLSS
jgi:putative phosphoribosyl transferase